MEHNTLQHLCRLSKLRYDENELEKVMSEMTEIVTLMDTIKETELTYDDTKDSNSIRYCDARKDVATPSSHSEVLLKNASQQDGCFVVPKVVD